MNFGAIEPRADADERRRGLGETIDLVGLADRIISAATKEPAAPGPVAEAHEGLGPHHHRWQGLEEGDEVFAAVSPRQRHLASREAVLERMGRIVTMARTSQKGKRLRPAPGDVEIGGDSMGMGAFGMRIDRGDPACDRP